MTRQIHPETPKHAGMSMLDNQSIAVAVLASSALGRLGGRLTQM
jgi:hypothetical protein